MNRKEFDLIVIRRLWFYSNYFPPRADALRSAAGAGGGAEQEYSL